MSKRTRVWGAVAAFALATSAIVWGVPGLSGAASQHANAPQQKQDASSAPVGGGTTGRATFQNLATAPERPANRGPVDNDENDEEEYLARAAHGTSTAASLPPSQRHATPAGNTPPALRGINFAATNQSQSGSFPPDNDLAVGRNHVVQVTNFAVSIFNKSGGFVKRTSFATFFNTSDFVFDPRVIYDPYWDRFVILGLGSTGSGASLVRTFRLAISTSGDPTGGYLLYSFGVGNVSGDALDFEQLGMDQDAILTTVVNFKGNGGFDNWVQAFSKARMYSGQGTSFNVFGGNPCRITPPYVLDQNVNSYFLTACPNDNKVTIKRMVNSSRLPPTYTAQAAISVPAYTSPPTAPQPGVNYPLETSLSNAFENRTIQFGNNLWAVHTITDVSATPRWYHFNPSANTQLANGEWFRSGTSSDWRPHLTANLSGELFGTWMSVDSQNNVNLQVRYIGEQGNTTAGTGAGSLLAGSTQPLTGQTFPAGRNRTGDYSAAALEPTAIIGCAANRRAWIVGEKTASANVWGSQIGRIGFC
jgi:hypothetical protein